jgi:hypothetical protein
LYLLFSAQVRYSESGYTFWIIVDQVRAVGIIQARRIAIGFTRPAKRKLVWATWACFALLAQPPDNEGGSRLAIAELAPDGSQDDGWPNPTGRYILSLLILLVWDELKWEILDSRCGEMGLGPGAVKLYLELWQRNLLANVESVIDMGSQELHLTRTAFKELVNAAGIKATKKKLSQI